MHSDQTNTIVAIATPKGQGGIGVVRLSGDKSLEIGLSIFKKKDGELSKKNIESHRVYYGLVCDPANGVTIDEALLVFMRGPKSYTCEDMVEISLHGSPVVLEQVLQLLINKGASLAKPGEFTKRAFLNKRFDLVQAEAVAELINSKSLLESKFAMRRISGELSSFVEKIRDKILNLISQFEAEIDFPEEGIELENFEQRESAFEEIEKDLMSLLKSYKRNSMVSSGIRVAIVGATNVGKSTLFNAILKRNRAITSDQPGTTRDYLSEELELNGLIVNLFDTAGLNTQTEDPIEKEGVDKTLEIIKDSDLILLVLDETRAVGREDKAVIDKLKDKEVLCVLNKIDLGRKIDIRNVNPFEYIEVSALKGINLEKLEDKMQSRFKDRMGDYNDTIAISSLRQKLEIEGALGKFQNVKGNFINITSPEFIAFDLKQVYNHLCQFRGDKECDLNEEVLNKIFSTFCIGK